MNTPIATPPLTQQKTCPTCGSTDRGIYQRRNGKSQTFCRPCQKQAAQKHYRNHIQPLDREDKKRLHDRYRDARRTASREWHRRHSGYYERRGLEAPPQNKRGRPRKFPIGDASTSETSSAATRPFEANNDHDNSR